MFDYIAYLMAQKQTAASAEEALPDRPVQPEAESTRQARRSHLIRHRLSDGLRWFADRLEPKHQRSMRLDCPSES